MILTKHRDISPAYVFINRYGFIPMKIIKFLLWLRF